MTDYEKETFNSSEFEGAEVNVNPSYIIMSALLKAQTVLVQDDPKTASLKYIMVADHVEKIAKSAKMLPDNYEEILKGEMKEMEMGTEDELIKQFKKANKRIELTTRYVFGNTTLKAPLKV